MLSVRQPPRANAAGLLEFFNRAISRVGILDWEKKLIGFRCDGASVNIGANGLRGFLEDVVSWIICFWCLAHRLQLALKDALDKTSFSTIDDMLLHLYYLYEKSPKKCRELNEIVESLKMCLDETEMSLSKGNRPMRSSGTRFVSHS